MPFSGVILAVEMVSNISRYFVVFWRGLGAKTFQNSCFSCILGASGAPKGSELAPFLVHFAGLGVA